jgi:hypothetical protein
VAVARQGNAQHERYGKQAGREGNPYAQGDRSGKLVRPCHHADQGKWRNQIELLLHRQRPRVQQRLYVGDRLEIVLLRKEIVIGLHDRGEEERGREFAVLELHQDDHSE